MIAYFYLSYVTSDFLFQLIGNLVFKNIPDAFDCIDDGTVLIPLTNGSAAYMLIMSLLLLSFSVMVLLVFYKIPENFGLVATRGRRIKRSMF